MHRLDKSDDKVANFRREHRHYAEYLPLSQTTLKLWRMFDHISRAAAAPNHQIGSKAFDLSVFWPSEDYDSSSGRNACICPIADGRSMAHAPVVVPLAGR